MKAIVIGATGATGKCIVQELIHDTQFDEVTVLVRRASFSPHPKLKEVIVDFNQLDHYKEYFSADVAYSVMGTTLKDAGSKEAQWKVDYEYQYEFAKICAAQKVKTFVLLSAIGATPTSSIFYSRMKGELEVAVKKLPFDALIIAQPASLLRPESNRWTEKTAVKLMRGLNQIGILKTYEVLHVQDLALALIKASNTWKKGIHTLKVKELVELSRPHK